MSYHENEMKLESIIVRISHFYRSFLQKPQKPLKIWICKKWPLPMGGTYRKCSKPMLQKVTTAHERMVKHIRIPFPMLPICSIHIFVIPKGKEREVRAGELFKEVIPKNFANFLQIITTDPRV